MGNGKIKTKITRNGAIKMGIADKYNKNVVSFNFDIPKDFEFSTLKELYQENGKDNAYIIMAFFFNTKGRYGKQTVIATPKELVNAPNHLTEMFEELMNDNEAVQSINEARLGFTIYEYENSYGTHYSLSLVDL